MSPIYSWVFHYLDMDSINPFDDELDQIEFVMDKETEIFRELELLGIM